MVTIMRETGKIGSSFHVAGLKEAVFQVLVLQVLIKGAQSLSNKLKSKTKQNKTKQNKSCIVIRYSESPHESIYENFSPVFDLAWGAEMPSQAVGLHKSPSGVHEIIKRD